MADDWYETVYENKHESINEFIKRKQVTGRSERTLNAYSRILKKFYHEEFPELRPEDTEVFHIEDYVMRLAQRDLSQNTKRRYLESLSAFFSYAMKRPRFEKITGNPAAVVLEEIPKQVRDRPDCATWENGRQIIHNISDPRDKTVATVLAKTGCRLTEALEIQVDDLMLEEGFIRLRKRKGGKQTVVPIDQETIKAIQRFQFIRNGRGTDYLFVSIRGERVSKTSVQRAVKKAAEEAGIMEPGEDRFHKKFTPHTYRTVFTTLMRNQGMPDHILRYIRGDSNDETMDIYTRVDRSQARQQYLNCIKTLEL
ncbi:tyrosine-type recombinase/integrase [Haloferax volcanii]|uniref:XerC/D-like integrase n=3 Tax=Haloferax volcanii TaxID=2246 RepID=A0A384L5V2_HALVD|nr:tyrosine-type recombinase/integrase [Haloferax volcanii]ADE02746.1 XerC/D-like integrase [Haloferax volcanii DS2]ELY33296.1 XerC/D-like integrase [Haloferax volcanii DS2]MBS8120625.1 tyrosine-type recombinase/integrase [Haloferax volcanii]MBS8125662.1 tyrosine-type recombinase/integrase [Haloferax volcanii]MBS8129671.1 tyrosine-type recombinase/integrase [Haloferax volcanii]